jgi:hypothetical protein
VILADGYCTECGKIGGCAHSAAPVHADGRRPAAVTHRGAVLLEPPPYEAPHPADVADEPPAPRTWRPVDLDAVLDGTYAAPVPTVGQRDDGVGLFYPGRAHTAAGESESLKTWFALAAARTELDRGNAVLFLDFEDDEGGVVGRLLAIGADREAVRKRFAYIRPEGPMGPVDRADLADALGDLRPTLSILDGVTEALSLHGLELKDNGEIARFGRQLIRPITATGAAHVSLDHVTKDAEGRGRYAIGAQHKLAGLNGAAYIVENREAFGIGRTGRSGIFIAKDRPGQLRRHALRSAGGRFWFADLVGVSHDETFVEMSIEPAAERSDEFRPTVLMRRVSDALEKAGRALSTQEVIDRVRGKRATDIRAALAVLVDEGFVSLVEGPRGAKIHTLVTPYGGETE